MHHSFKNFRPRRTLCDPEGGDKRQNVLINIYASNKDTNIVEFLKDLGTTLQNENLDEEENIILGGNFNCPLNPMLDKKGGILLPRKSVIATIDCLCADFDLVDIWSEKSVHKKLYLQPELADDSLPSRLLAYFE